MSLATAAPAKNVPATKLGRMYEQHIQMILDKDINGLLGQYAEDAVLISSFEKKPRYFRGHQELREHFNGILAIEDLQTEDRLLGRNQAAGNADGRRIDSHANPAGRSQDAVCR